MLATGTAFHERQDVAAREDSVSLFLRRSSMDRRFSGVWPLVRTWGGEGIYMSRTGSDLRPVLERLGSPSIVVVGIDLSTASLEHRVYPGVLHCFVRRELDWPGGSDVRYRGSIPAAQVLDIWQPGNPEFDRHAELLDAISRDRA